MRKLAIVVALSSTVLATPALARNSAWYVGGDFGATIVEDIGFDFGIGPVIPGAGSNAQIGLNHDYGYDAALFVGYDLGAFRIEAEVAYKRARVDDIETSVQLPGRPSAGGAPVGAAVTPDLYPAGGGRTSALSFMINGMLDFGDDDGVSGFVGGGVGVARVDYNNVRAFSNQGAAIDDSDTRFAWQVVAGLRQAISDNVDITLRYRFFNADNIRTVDFRGLESESRFRSHSLLGGITFNFGAPPPPPPPPPPCPEGWSRDASGVCVAPPAPPPPPQTQTCPNGAVILATEACPEPPPIGPFIVFFDWDKDDITPAAAGILDNAAAAYQQTGRASVTLAGHADRSGSDAYNVGLSQRRANNVRSYLAGRGVPDGSITTEAFGESRPLVDTADGVREPQNRRVEITFGPGSGW
jgi:outer membrane protein OmpA-like peptidoglycan-associated protein/opacity protein-like surface antigen